MKLISSRSKRAVARKPITKAGSSQKESGSSHGIERKPTGIEHKPTGRPNGETAVPQKDVRKSVGRTRKPAKVKKKIGHKVLLIVFFLILLITVVGFGIWIFMNVAPPLPDLSLPPIEDHEDTGEPNITEIDIPTPAESNSPADLLKAAAIEIIDVAVPLGDEVTTENFLMSVTDPSIIIFSDFLIAPDPNTIGSQIVEIAIEDAFNNREVVTVLFTVLSNDVPPLFKGLRPIDAMRGGNIVYRQGVSALDAFGRPLDFTFDASDVNPDRLGIYTVVYRAEDVYGLVTEEEVEVHVVDIDPDWVNERIDGIFEDIFDESMTQVDQAKAIFTWIKANVTFMPMASAPPSAYEGAYRGLRDRKGGCTIFSSLSDVMLNRAGIPTLRIERVAEAPTRHRWNLINPDELGWYHFDAFPIQLGGPRNELYLFTASHAANFTRQMGAVENGVAMYYVYDASLYPEIVEECNEVCAC